MAKSAIALRINVVVNELIDYADKQQDSPFQAHLWLVRSLFGSIAEELDGATDEMLSHWMNQFGKLMEWCATGDWSVLPPEVQEYMKQHHSEMLAIEA